ncbi:calmodulin-lysine N-methyltransferase-like [Mercenaria mercenaria]|uniref:calmodulin-lysine N-methyltransferase-like n=1 Tax=Mercenaria mercenaria TaxID=6596 RepID=UPI00234FA554|nr:calmodulin-lysine N-methyltransferase-like [Mercenaria mercenaria]
MSSPCAKKRKIDQDTIAVQRWKILKEILINGRSSLLTSENRASVRRFKSFNVLQTQQDDGTDREEDWFIYTAEKWPHFKMYIRHLSNHVKPEALRGFNNTGNVCVWPAEEVLTYYCLSHPEMFNGKSVIELGGGMTCLAGMALSIMSDVSYMELTDGNEDSVSNLDEIITRNSFQFKDTRVLSRVVRWGSGKTGQDLNGVFDFVLCADCFFFEEGREDLVETIYRLLKDDGEAILFAPKRGNTFEAFVTLAQSLFNTDVKERYDDTIWTIHCKMKNKGKVMYDPDIHYPWFLHISKKTNREKTDLKE